MDTSLYATPTQSRNTFNTNDDRAAVRIGDIDHVFLGDLKPFTTDRKTDGLAIG